MAGKQPQGVGHLPQMAAFCRSELASSPNTCECKACYGQVLDSCPPARPSAFLQIGGGS